MASAEQVKLLNQGVRKWNRWREDKFIKADLSTENFIKAKLGGVDLIIPI